MRININHLRLADEWLYISLRCISLAIKWILQILRVIVVGLRVIVVGHVWRSILH